MSDSQRQAVYAAEHRLQRLLEAASEGTVRAFGTAWQPEREILFGEVEDVQRYVDKVLAHIGCERPITVRRRKGNRHGHYESWTSTIALPPRSIGGGWTLRESVVLHEIAHHLSRQGESHGPEFARALVDLLDVIGNPVTSRLLHICLHEEGVKVGS